MIMLKPPTSHLPPIRNIYCHPTEALLESLRYLRMLYIPEVRGSRRRVIDGKNIASMVPSCGETPGPSLAANLDSLRSDQFERSYAIKWLTACISQIDCCDNDQLSSNPQMFASLQEREGLVQQAASLLAACAGTSAAGTITRLFTFESVHTQGAVLSVHLTDAPLENHDFGSVGAQTWGGACVLAEMIVECPGEFGLAQSSADEERMPDNQEFRVLELGAGTGLVSLTLGKLLEILPGRTPKRATILATDFYPSVLANLRANVASNFSSAKSPISVATCFLDWSTFSAAEAITIPFDEPFDLVLGADIVYEAQHAVWIKQCLMRLLRRPEPFEGTRSLSKEHLFHLIIPLRPTHATESNTVEEVFPRAEYMRAEVPQHLELAIFSKEIITCDTHRSDQDGRDGDVDEVKYAYYKIGWC